MSYGAKTWDVGKLYKAQDAGMRVPMSSLLGIPGDAAAAPTPVVPNDQKPSAQKPWMTGFAGPLGMALKQLQQLYEIPSRAKETVATIEHPMNVYRGLADPFDPEKAMAMAGMVQTGGIGGTTGGAGVALGSGPVFPQLQGTTRAAARFPTGKGAPDPLKLDLPADMAAMRADPEFFAKQTENLAPLISEKTMGSADPEAKWAEAGSLIMNNLRALYERQDPRIRSESTKWYPGGQQIAGELAQKHGIPRQSASAGIAVLSPQAEWFVNLERARRGMDYLSEDPRLTKDMVQALAKGSPGFAKHAPTLGKQVGKKLSEMEPKDAALAIIARDRLNPERSYQRYAPSGQQLGTVNAPSGKPANFAYMTSDTVRKMVEAYRSGGDMNKISPLLGYQNKVRNFYNDIESADMPGQFFPDYTSDTHNVAASLLRPLAQSDIEVGVGLGTQGGYSSKTGMGGLYGLYADAGRQVAKEVGVAPSQVQSPTWEAVRGLFPDDWKTQPNKDMVKHIWDAWRKGEITENTARQLVFEMRPEDAVNRVPWRDYMK